MEKKSNALILSPFIGHGNPATALSICNLLSGKALVFDGLGVSILKKGHRFVSQNSKTSESYTEKGETLRSIGGMAIGFLELMSLLNRSLLKTPLSDIGIFVQEHLLGVLPESLLEKWFPAGVFLAIPDVSPKKSAEDMLRKKENVLPIVWNKTVFNELKKQGLDSILTAPFLPEGFVADVDFKNKQTQRKIVVKSSGSGMPNEWVGRLMGYSIREGIDIEIWLPDEKITIIKGQKSRESLKEKTLEEYLKEFYQSLVDAPPEYLISYPSEMVQVAAWMRNKGWNGIFGMLPPKGAHEEKNKEWAERFLRSIRIDFSQEKLDILNQQVKEPENDLSEELGKDKVNILLSLKRDYRLLKHKYWQQLAKEYAEKTDKIANLHPKDQIKVIELLLNFNTENKRKGILVFLDLAQRVLQSSNFVKELYKKALENFSLNQANKTLVLEEILKEAGFNEDQIKDMINFSFAGFDVVKGIELTGILSRFIIFLRQKYQISEKDLKRKVNEGLYLRHILRTAVLTNEIYNQLSDEERKKIDYRVLIFTAFFHDYKELRQKNGQDGDVKKVKKQLQEYGFLSDEEIKLVFELCEKLTPVSIDKTKMVSYIQGKQEHFHKIWQEKDDNERKYLRIIESADVLANFEETVADLENGMEDGKMKVPKFWRMRVFYERSKEIEKEFPFLKNKIKDLKNRLKNSYVSKKN